MMKSKSDNIRLVLLLGATAILLIIAPSDAATGLDVIFSRRRTFAIRTVVKTRTNDNAFLRTTLSFVRGGSDNLEDEDENTGETTRKGKRSFLDAAAVDDESMEIDDEEEVEEEEDEEQLEEEEEYEELEEALVMEDLVEEEEEEDNDEFDEGGSYIQVDHQRIFDDDEEDEVSFVVEESTIEKEAVYEETVEETEESGNIGESEEFAGKPSATTQEVLERAFAGINSDDENSSAFVDRMELADAYDLEETVDEVSAVVKDAEAMAAVTAATAVGAGGSDPEETQPVEVDEEATATTTTTAKEGALEKETAPSDKAVISEEMRNVLLKELKFKPGDLKVIRPEIAAMVATNKLQKPQEGMPPNWYLPTAPKRMVETRRALVKASLTAASVAATTLLAIKGQDTGIFDLDEIDKTLQKIPAALAGIPAALGSVAKGKTTGPKSSSTAEAIEKAKEEVQAVPDVETEEDRFDMETHPHSVKPGSSKAPSYEEDLDKTILDKFLTKIENAIKAFFRIKI